ncbi:hypothetical protein B8V81_4700 [Paenibacillus pasadenensis]|uniref:Uncharacterized protein n=1 Tax=Paenibacillus pasadenensis TaxID=217090 RepID=A0A2N5N7K8_9BACL|nr:hypothetical protein B8V81_4700 [Paenibacillus pasadenensis]
MGSSPFFCRKHSGLEMVLSRHPRPVLSASTPRRRGSSRAGTLAA